jgi:hypothetical protein
VAKEIIPWEDRIKKTGKLTIKIDDSIGQHGWAKAFKDGIAKFNELSIKTWKLGVTFETTDNFVQANVVAQAKTGNFDFGYKDAWYTMEEKPVKFDGNEVHGMCTPLHAPVRNRVKHVDEIRLVKAFIFVPAKPQIKGGNSRTVGEPVKLVIVVHELLHACGPDNDHHTDNDVFAWPSARFESANPDDDRLEVPTGQREDVLVAPGKTVSKPVTVLMPPIFLNSPTQNKIRDLWTK